jgi:hypothetical protein
MTTKEVVYKLSGFRNPGITGGAMITIGNWYIINKAELAKIQSTEIALKRKFTPAQIDSLREGKTHLHRNPVKKEKVAA